MKKEKFCCAQISKMNASVRCTCRKVPKLGAFNRHIAEIMESQKCTREQAVVQAYQKVGAVRLCCQSFLLTHIEISNKQCCLSGFEQLEADSRSTNHFSNFSIDNPEMEDD